MVGIWSFSKTMVTEPAEAKALGETIAAYTLPEGYSEMFGMRFLGADVVAIAGDITSPDSMMVMMMKIPNTGQVDQEFLAKQFETAISQQFPVQGLDLTLDTVETRTINGQEIPLTFRKGSNSAGDPYRQMSALIPGEDSSLFVMVQGSEAEWDQDALFNLLDSIH